MLRNLAFLRTHLTTYGENKTKVIENLFKLSKRVVLLIIGVVISHCVYCRQTEVSVSWIRP